MSFVFCSRLTFIKFKIEISNYQLKLFQQMILDPQNNIRSLLKRSLAEITPEAFDTHPAGDFDSYIYLKPRCRFWF